MQAILEKKNAALYDLLSKSYMQTFNNAERIRKASFPILNIYGDEDYCIIASHQRELGKLNGHIQNLEIKGSAHFPFLCPEHKAQVLSAMQQFIANSLGTGATSAMQ